MGIPADADRIEQLAQKLLHDPTEDAEGITDIEAARRTARARLEDSEARTLDPAVTNQRDPGVIRRSSEETAQEGESR